MAVTRIKNNQITDATVVANAKLVDYSISSAKLANNLTYNSDLTITGNLTVQGNATSIDTTITTIEDPVITLASTQTSGTPTVDIGFLGYRGNVSNIAFVWDESAAEFVTAFTSTGQTNTTITISSYADFHTNNANIGGNLTLGGNLSITGNVANLNVTGNIAGGNLLTPGLISAAANVTGGNILTAGLISATSTITTTANISGGNILFGSGIVTGTGNIYGGNIISGNAVIGNIDVSGNISVNSLTSNTFVSATGNVVSGNVTTAGLVTATGTITGGNLATGGLISATGTITSAANITGGNLATGGLITATGNITGGNLLTPGLISAAGLATSGNIETAGYVSATGNVTALAVNTATLASSGGITITTTGANGNISLTPNGTGNIVLGGNTYINGVSLNPVQDNDVASKYYVDTIATTGITIHEAVLAATNTTLATATGGTVTYNQPNGAANGIGATLTTTGTYTFIDTANVQTVGTRILVKDQANAVQNGVYVYSNATVITRSTDTDQYGADSAESFSINDYFFTTGGNVNAGTAFVVSAPAGVITFGTSNISFGVFSQSQVYSANTAAGLSLIGTVFSAKVDNNTTAFDNDGNIIVKAGANLTTPNIGAATGTSLSATGNIQGGNILTGGFVTATGNLAGGNVTTAGLISATGTITSAANITGGNILTAGLISATGNATLGNVGTNQLSLSGNVISALNVTGNITGGNLLTAGLISTSGNVYAENILNTAGNTQISMGNGSGIIGITSTANTTQFLPGGQISLGGASRIQGGTFTGSYLTLGASQTDLAQDRGGNVTVQLGTGGTIANTWTFAQSGAFLAPGDISATGNVTGANLILTTGIIDGPANGRITINGSDIDTDFAVDGDTLANVFYVDAGTGTASFGSSTQVTNAIVNFATTTSIKTPVGNTAQRPAVGVTGMLRFNTTNNNLELYDNSQWTAVGVPVFTVIADEQFNGDGSTVAFTLSSTQTTNSCIVSINGVVQIPTSAYSVSGTDPTCVLTFTEAPLSGDLIDVREITTTTSVTSIANSSGNAVVAVSDTAAQVNVTGDLSVNGTILGGNINSTAITNGNSNMSVIASGGNIRANVAGTTVQTISAGLVAITGDLSVSGNATLSGNILGDRIQNGTTQIDIQTPGGNANITIGGTSNTAVFSNTALTLATPLLPSANITYDLGSTSQRWKDLWLSNSTIYLGNAQFSANATALILTNPSGGTTVFSGVTPGISVTGNVTGGNITTGGVVSATGAITGAAITGTSLTVSTGNITAGNLLLSGAIIDSGQLDIQTSASNSNIALAPNGTGIVTVSTQVSAVGNVTGGNLRTAGSISATGAVTGASVVGGVMTGSSVSVTGAVTGASVVGGVMTGSSVSVTGAVTGASVVGGVMTGSSVSVTGAVTGASVVGGVMTGTSVSVTGNITGGNLSGTNIVGTLTTAAQTNITSVGTLSALSVTGNVQGGNLRTAGLISATGSITGASVVGGVMTGSSLSVTGTINGTTLTGTSLTVSTGNITGGNLLISGAIEDSGQLDIRTTASNGNIVLTPNGTGAIIVAKDIINGQGNGVGNIGAPTFTFNTIFAKATSAQYADLAEKYTADAEYSPGTVVVFGGTHEVTANAADADRKIAGVVSTNPSYIMNAGLQAEHVATVALTGRVPTMVIGPVRKGDMMVAAGLGRARAEADPKVGTVIGKALEDFDGAEGTIEVVVGRF